VKSDDGIAGVMFSTEQTLQIEAMQDLLDVGELAARLGDGLWIRLRRQLEIDFRFVELAELFAPSRERFAQRRPFAQQVLRFLTVVPEVRSRGCIVELLNPNFARRNVKGTSRTPVTVLRRPPRVLRARSSRRSCAHS
jgi:hypothetical protein